MECLLCGEHIRVKTARFHLVDDWEGCKAFIQEVGYPVIVKPDTGVGASNTEKLTCDEELAAFFVAKLRGAPLRPRLRSATSPDRGGNQKGLSR